MIRTYSLLVGFLLIWANSQTSAAIRRNRNADCNCGWKKPEKIVGGRETGVNEYPMMAGIAEGLNRRLVCGATIISNYHVLTAAHCVFGKNLNRISVVIGEHNVNTRRESRVTQFLGIKRNYIHPEFDGSIHDLAILEVANEINYGSLIGPACLPFARRNVNFAKASVEILGWGSVSFGGAKSKVLQKANLGVMSLRECQATYPIAQNNNLCTHAPGKDACQFDSGGPVFWQNPLTRRIVLVAVLSDGQNCGDSPGLNIRVGYYMNWIKWITQNAMVCELE